MREREKVVPPVSIRALRAGGGHAFLAWGGACTLATTRPRFLPSIRFARENRQRATPSESLLWRALRGRKLGFYFRRQHPISAFIVDFACTTRRLVVEIDASIHRIQQERDAHRQRVLEALGWRVVRLDAERVERDVAGAIAVVRAALE